MREQWRPVAGYEGLYEVSDLGRVRSVDRVVAHAVSGRLRLKGRVLKPGLSAATNGGPRYLIVILSRGGKHRTVRVHRLVAEAFVPGQASDREVCHNDGDALNCAASNLRWGTKRENAADTVRHGRHVHARKTHCLRGHEFTDSNTRLRADGKRDCRACQRERRALLAA